MTDQPEPSQAEVTPKTSLTSRIVKGSAWVFVGKLASRGLQAVKLVVLARLLVPEDFGLFGIVTLALAAAETFTQTGFQTALIQKQGNTDDYLDTAWTVQVARGFALTCILFAAAPLVAWFFDEPRAAPLLRVLSAVEILRGFTNIGIVYFRKELEFHKQVAYQLISSAFALAVGIGLAWHLRNVWALVWATLAGQLTSTTLSYIFHPYRPRVRLDWTQAAELFGFGRWVLLSSIMAYAGMRLDELTVGRLVGTAALGIYGMAYTISLLPLRETTYAVSSVLLPGYAQVQGNDQRLRRAYERAVAITGLFSLPACTGMILLARPIVQLALGDQWLAAVMPIRILALAQLIKSVISTGSPFFIGMGKPRYEFFAQLARVAGLAVCIVPAILLFDLEGAALAVVFSALAMFGAYIWCLNRVLDRPARLLVRALLPPLVGSSVMTIILLYPVMLLSRYEGPRVNQVMLLMPTVVLGGGLYFAGVLGTCRSYSESTLLRDMERLLLRVKRTWHLRIRSGSPLATERSAREQ